MEIVVSGVALFVLAVVAGLLVQAFVRRALRRAEHDLSMLIDQRVRQLTSVQESYAHNIEFQTNAAIKVIHDAETRATAVLRMAMAAKAKAEPVSLAIVPVVQPAPPAPVLVQRPRRRHRSTTREERYDRQTRLLAAIERAGKPVTRREMVRANASEFTLRDVSHDLRKLTDTGLVIRTGTNHRNYRYAIMPLPAQVDLLGPVKAS